MTARIIIIMSLAWGACGSSGGSGNPCDPANPDCPDGEVCNAQTKVCETATDSCTVHGDCADGQHCGDNGFCQASVLGSPCETDAQCGNLTCTDAKLCGCDGETFTADQRDAAVLVMLDRSGSMKFIYPSGDEVPEPNKWSEARAAVNGMTAAVPQAHFGLMMYPFTPTNGPEANCNVSAPSVAVGANTAGPISTAMNNGAPRVHSFTPILNVLDLANQNNYFPDPARVPAIALVTDGAHSTECRATNDRAADAAAIVTQLTNKGIKTFAIGYAQNADTVTLNAIAQAGGTNQYIPANDGAALKMALEQIAGEVATCSFSVAATNISDIVVLVNDQMVDEDAANGYTFADGQLTFHGTACDSIKSATQANVKVVTQCATDIE